MIMVSHIIVTNHFLKGVKTTYEKREKRLRRIEMDANQFKKSNLRFVALFFYQLQFIWDMP